jgi:DnaK suppressor protein
MLSEKKKSYFRKLLTKQLDALMEEEESAISEISELRNESPDFVDQASAESEVDFTLHIKERESKLILKIQEALQRLDEGTFGICEECDEEISEKRLKARPVTTLCIDCKKEQEAREKTRGL